MATRVQRAWTALREEVRTPAVSSIAALRDWLEGDLLQVSRKLPPLLDEAKARPAWRIILTASVENLAVSRRAWDEFAQQVQADPPTLDPVRLLEWAKTVLWSLCVFTLPDDSCDCDQFDLELWVSQRGEPPILACGLGHYFTYQHRAPRDSQPLEPWTGDPDTLLPADRTLVGDLLPNAKLLPVESGAFQA